MTSLAEKPLLMGTKREFFPRKLIFPFSRTEQKVCKSRASSKRKREKLFKAAMMPELTYYDRLLSLAVITKDNETSDCGLKSSLSICFRAHTIVAVISLKKVCKPA